jgi:hypothetical protein
MTVEHGKSFISFDGNIITVKAVGSFNREGIVKTIEELKSVIEVFYKKKFKLLFDYLEIEGGAPDVFDKINECNIWLNSQNMVAKALVINSPMHLAILESRTPARRSQNSKSFDDKASAINWLNSQA